MKLNLQNKTAIITGGASGIGRALSLALAARGCRVFAADINEKGILETAALINTSGGSCRGKTIDVTDRKAVKKLVKTTVAETGTLDFFFNCAAISVMGPGSDITESQWDHVMAVNYQGVLNGTLSALDIMTQQKYGHIINISSMAGFAPFALNAPYTASKYGVTGLTGALREEAAAKGVLLHLACPGIVDSPFYHTMETAGIKKSMVIERLPFFAITPDKAAAHIIRGLMKKRKVIIFPAHARLLNLVARFCPCLITAMNRRLLTEFKKAAGP